MNRLPRSASRAKAVLAVLLAGASLAFYRAHPVALPSPYRPPPADTGRPASGVPGPAENQLIAVTVTGEAERTGVVQMVKGTTLRGLLEAVRPTRAAYTAHADYGYILRHGDEIHIPAAIPQSGGRILLSDETLLRIRVQSRFAAEDPAVPTAGRIDRVNINRATLEELQELPRIGPETARRIIQERESQGPFRRKEELLRVRGIGRKTYEWLEPRISVE